MDNIVSALAVHSATSCSRSPSWTMSVNGSGASWPTCSPSGTPTQPTPSPNSKSDAQLALTRSPTSHRRGLLLRHRQQGRHGGTGASLFNFNQQLAAVWGGQVV
jgi:hypothetical protein